MQNEHSGAGDQSKGLLNKKIFLKGEATHKSSSTQRKQGVCVVCRRFHDKNITDRRGKALVAEIRI